MVREENAAVITSRMEVDRMIKLDALDIIKHLQKEQKNTEPLMEFAQKIEKTLRQQCLEDSNH